LQRITVSTSEETQMRATRTVIALIFMAIAIPALHGCGGGSSDTKDPESYVCVRDPTLLVQARDCVLDEGCPCGTHCALGRCVYDCVESSECGDGLGCDAFGRCSDGSLVHGLPTGPSPRMEALTDLLDFPVPGTERQLHVRINGDPVGPLRVVAREDLEVRCHPDGSFSPECFFEPTGDVEVITIDVRSSDDPVEAGRSAGVELYLGNQRVLVSGHLWQPQLPPPEASDPRLTGVYLGVVRLEGAGSQASSHVETLPVPFKALELPVTMTVYEDAGGAHVVHLTDDLGALFPEGGIVGALSSTSAEAWRLDLPAWPLLSGERAGWTTAWPPEASDWPATTEEIWIADVEAEAYWGPTALTATLTTVFEGLTLPEASPLLTWRLVVSHQGPLSEGEGAPAASPPYEPEVAPERAEYPLEIEVSVADALELAGDDPVAMAGAVLCSLSSEETGALSSELLLDGGDVSVSGDLACENAGGPYAAMTFGLLGSSALTIHETVASCLDDLAALDDEAGGAAAGALCVDPGRVLAALGYALEADRSRALGLGDPVVDEAASALAHRLLQQWLALHVFLGREAARIEQLGAILGPDDPQTYDVDAPAALAASMDGWSLLFQPRIAVGLMALPASVLAEPDYRAWLDPDAQLSCQAEDHGVGLPVAMMDTARAQLVVLTERVEAATAKAQPPADLHAPVRALLGRTFVGLALAQSLHGRTMTLGEPPWEEDWVSARLGFAASLRALLDALDQLSTGGNPLGIDDRDLPLYQVGDEEGAHSRFSALTDFLLGVTTDGIAQYMVSRAADDLDAARAAFVANLERDLYESVLDDRRERRLEAIRRKVGEEIIGLCGDIPWPSIEVLDHRPEIDIQVCYIAASCQLTAEEFVARQGSAEVGKLLCRLSRARGLSGPSLFADYPELNAQLAQVEAAFDSPELAFPLHVTGLDGTVLTVESSEDAASAFSIDVDFITIKQAEESLGLASAEVIEDVLLRCEAAYQATLSRRPANAIEDGGFCERNDHCPPGDFCSEQRCVAATVTDPACFVGAIGSQALAVRAASAERSAAWEETREFIHRKNVALSMCGVMTAAGAAREAIRLAADTAIAVLNGFKLAMDIDAVWCDAIAESVGADSWMAAFVPAAFHLSSALFKTASLTAQYLMDELQRMKDFALVTLEEGEAITLCWIEAAYEDIGLEAALFRHDQAQANLLLEINEFEGLKGYAKGLLDEGLVELHMEASRRTSPIATDFWIDEHFTRYQRSMRQARRTVYLTLLAAEYEFQLSSSPREEILSAATPDDLQEVIDELRNRSMTGGVEGASPSDQLHVLSLRDHLLQLGDFSIYPDGWHQLSDVERFRILLAAPEHAVYDTGGVYKGQEIPFSLAPLGSIGVGDDFGIPLLAGMDCAERLWSVNVSLLGEDLQVGSETTFTTLALRKRNTFYSQWCNEGAHDEPYQLASTRPSHNLFIDPLGTGEDYGFSLPRTDPEALDEANAYTSARVAAYFNVSQAEMEDEAYFNGDSQELAGRGLYGDYALFFPIEALSVDDGNGLRLENVEDVLLRLDFVSVARSW
jgi:hypothetical protein